MSGRKWGSPSPTLYTTYKTFIKTIITYCCSPLITGSHSAINKLEQAQNEALRLITGAVKTTPITAMHTTSTDIKANVFEAGLKLQKQLTCVPGINYPVTIKTFRRLNNQKKLFHEISKAKKRLELSFTIRTVLLWQEEFGRTEESMG